MIFSIVFMDAIFERRSIRAYTSKSIADKQIKTLLKAGFCAPSARNEQPWHFIVVKDRVLLDAIPSFHQYSHMLAQAKAVIVVCGDTEIESNIDYLNQDCAAAIENILIEAQMLGLGAVWLGLHPRIKRVQGMRTLLDIPDTILPVGMVALGQPAEKKPPNDRYLAERVHSDSWDNV